MYTTTSRLQLRPFKTTDLEAFLAYRSDPEIARYHSFDPFTLEKAQQFVAEQAGRVLHRAGEWIQIGLAIRESDLLIGDCAVHLLASEPLIAQIGYTISTAHQRQGYGREGVGGLLSYLFDIKGLHKIYALIDSRNQASIALVQGLGFKQEAHFRQNYWENNQWWDEVQYAILEEEFSTGKNE